MILFFYGPNTYAARQKVKELVERFKKTDNAAFGLEWFEAASLAADTSAEKIVSAITSVPFLASHKLVVIEDMLANASLSEAVLAQLSRVPDTTVVVIYEREPDERTKGFKTLKQLPKAIKFGLLTPSKLVAWLQKTTRDLGGEIEIETANYLVTRVGNDQWRLSNELTKLVSYNPKITKASIDELTEPGFSESIFDLVDSLSHGQTEPAIRLYQGLRATKAQPLYILSMIGWGFRNLIIAKAASGRSPGEIAKDFKLSPYVVGKSLRVIANVNLASLRKCVALTMDVDKRLKSTAIDPDIAIEQLLIDLSLLLSVKSKVATI